jgi:hypothetical protein
MLLDCLHPVLLFVVYRRPSSSSFRRLTNFHSLLMKYPVRESHRKQKEKSASSGNDDDHMGIDNNRAEKKNAKSEGCAWQLIKEKTIMTYNSTSTSPS